MLNNQKIKSLKLNRKRIFAKNTRNKHYVGSLLSEEARDYFTSEDQVDNFEKLAQKENMFTNQ